jgi:hypothetical protein
MARATVLNGSVVQYDQPEWQPLLDAVGEMITGDFMWMHEVELSDGTPLHAYKHIDTSQYLHLTADGRAFVYESSDRYRLLRTPMDVYRLVYAYEHRYRRRGHCRGEAVDWRTDEA